MPFKDPEKAREYQRMYREKNHDKLLKEKLEWQKNNPEKRKIILKRYSEKNKIKLRKYQKKYLKEFPEKRKETSRKYYNENKEKLLLLNKDWLKDNPDYMKGYRTKNKSILNENRKSRLHNDMEFKIGERIRVLLRKALLKYSKTGKTMKSEKYGINYLAIIEHLKPFPEDISKYHIDHIRPLCTFDLNDLEQVKQAFAPENLRWLLAEDNMRRKKYQIE